MYIAIHLYIIYALLMFSNSMKIIKIDGNMPDLGQIVCKNTILTLAHLLVLSCEFCVNVRK
jgi:hypothetical protein